LTQIAEFDRNCWFDPTALPTCRVVAQYAHRIFEADLRYPIILSAEGYLMDGSHRVAEAYLPDMDTVSAVQFPRDPEPD
jgi:disulfide oxidoreductase YuzD